MASEVTRTLWEQSLIDDLEELKAKKLFANIPLAVETLTSIIESFEEELSKQDVDISTFKDCPKCGDERQPNTNFCSRCGYETGQCNHAETGYHQDGRLYCLKCKKPMLYASAQEYGEAQKDEVL